MSYQTIVADPPWDYGTQNIGRRTNEAGEIIMHGTGAADSYQRMSADQIAGLRVEAEAAPNAHLYLWTTNSFIVEAHAIVEAWGFRYVTMLTWVKMQQSGEVSRKAGYYFRGATEHCLFGVRGTLPLLTTDALPTAFLWPRAPHSVKPDAFYDLVETASPAPRLELFARRARFGWDYWGDQSLGTIGLR